MTAGSAERAGFDRGARLRLGAPFAGSLFVRLVLFGVAITSEGAAFSVGLAMFVTAFTSVGIGVEVIAGLVKGVCGSSKGEGASTREAVAIGAIAIGLADILVVVGSTVGAVSSTWIGSATEDPDCTATNCDDSPTCSDAV